MRAFPLFWGFLRRSREDLLGVLFPASCGLCGRLTASRDERGICLPCWSGIELLTGPCCPRCGRPQPSLEDDDLQGVRCGGCARRPPPFAAGLSMGAYRGPLRGLIHLLKFADRPDLAAPLAARAASFLRLRGGSLPPLDLVVPVPLPAWRRLRRGYNQSAELARELAARLGLPSAPRALRRRGGGPPQAALPASRRAANVRGAFRATRPERLFGRSVLLVDDVWTTGATLWECSRCLRTAGARAVVAFSVARSVPDLAVTNPAGFDAASDASL